MIEGMDQGDRLLTVKELADYLGVPVATIYAWRYRGEGPPGFRVGRHLRFRQGDVEQWIWGQLEASSRRPWW
ncbi:MAG: helix-turn-helix domain-containing protein [Acidimicrobiia bacterium]